jgi:hypothetical protein
VYEQVREELESMGCQVKTGCEVKSVSRFNEGIYISAVLLYPSRCFGRFVKNRCMGAIGTSYGMQIVFSLLTSIQDPHIEMNNLTKIISYIFLDNGKSYGLKHRFSREREASVRNY